jgi:hypothetical protein
MKVNVMEKEYLAKSFLEFGGLVPKSAIEKSLREPAGSEFE